MHAAGGTVCADSCQESFAAAWLSLAVKYYYTVWAGILQEEASVGYQQLLLSPNIPWASARTGQSVGGPARSLDWVRASMQAPNGRVASAWARQHHPKQQLQQPKQPQVAFTTAPAPPAASVSFEFVVPPGTTSTQLLLPIACPRSNISVVSTTTTTTDGDGDTKEQSHLIYTSGQGRSPSDSASGADAPATKLLAWAGDKTTKVVGSYLAIAIAAQPGHHRLTLTGSDPAVPVCATASAGTGKSMPSLRCPAGMLVVSIEQAVFGFGISAPATCGGAPAAVGCSAGSTRFQVERRCLGKAACALSAETATYDPVGQLSTNCPAAGATAAHTQEASTLYVQALCGVV